MGTMTIGRTLKVLLEERGMAQKDLARQTGLTETSISRYASGERMPNARSLMRIAKALGVDEKTLIDGPKRAGWEHVGSDRSSRFRCPSCKEIAYYPQTTRGERREASCPYRFCPNCGRSIQV